MDFANTVKVSNGGRFLEFGYEDGNLVDWVAAVELTADAARTLETALSAQRQVRELDELRERKARNRRIIGGDDAA